MCSIQQLTERVTAELAALAPADAVLGTAGADYLALRGVVERLEVVALRLLAAVDASGASTADGSASTAAWVRRRTGCSGREAAADVSLARRLHTDGARPLSTTAALLDAGRLTVGHARVIARATATSTVDAFATAEPLVAKAAVDLPVDVTAQVAAAVCEHAEALHAGGAEDPSRPAAPPPRLAGACICRGAGRCGHWTRCLPRRPVPPCTPCSSRWRFRGRRRTVAPTCGPPPSGGPTRSVRRR